MIIYIASGKGRTGKTTVATNLTLSIGKAQFIDCDVEEPNANIFLKKKIKEHEDVSVSIPKINKIKCNFCGSCHPMELKNSLELYKWRCPECAEGTCEITNLSDEFKDEVEKLNKEIMLEPIELEIVSILNDEQRKMRAGEISALIDTTHQLVGKRTSKLQEMGLVDKERDGYDGRMKSEITERCEETYFAKNKL